MDEALQRVTGAQLAQLMFPQFDPAAERTLLATRDGRLAGGRGGRGGVRLGDGGRPGRGGEQSCWCAGRPTPTTSRA